MSNKHKVAFDIADAFLYGGGRQQGKTYALYEYSAPQQGDHMESLQALRSISSNLERPNFEELVALRAFATGLALTYQDLSLESPEWLSDAKAALDKEIVRRNRDNLESELRETEARLEGLKTADEKRQDLRAKQERLRAALGPTQQVKPAGTAA